MSDELKIRPFQIDDQEKLIEILKLNVPAHFAETEIQDFKNYLNNEIEDYFVIEWNGKLVGSGGLNFEENYKTGKISWDFINPDFQGRGIGRKLLAYRLEILKSDYRVEKVLVRTSQHAYQFYEKNGFVVREIHKDFWAAGFDMYKMILKT